MRPAAALLVGVVAGVGCRQIFGIDDTRVVTGDVDAPPGGIDAPVVAFDGVPDATPDARPPPDADPPDAMPDAFVCPTGYGPELTTGHRYRLINTTSLWPSANADCNDDIAGHTHLAIPDNAAEEAAIIQYLATNTFVWIGIHDELGNNTWRTVLGAVPTYFDWESGEPDLGSADCVYLEDSSFFDGWIDTQCSSGAGQKALCECE